MIYEIPIRGSMKYQDGESVTYTCLNDIYRFPQEDNTPKDQWENTLDVVCGWENQWDPPIVPGCVDPRGCELPPPRNERIWGSFEDTNGLGSLDVGSSYWYECRDGVFEDTDGIQKPFIELFCVNDPYGGPPYWFPLYDHDINPFPKCVVVRKYHISLKVRRTMHLFK